MKAAAILTWLLLGLYPCYHCLRHTTSQSDSGLAFNAEDSELLVQEASADRSFWLSEWGALEGDLLRLEHLAKGEAVSEVSGLQLAAKPEKKEAVAQTSSNSTKSQPHADKAKGTGSVDLGKLMKSVMTATGKSSASNPMKAAALLPALEMLKGMYADGKDRITKLNSREQKLKKQYEEREKSHKAQLAKIEGRFKNHTLSAGFRQNETQMENRMWSYWERVRERQHRQYHTSLKIQHSMMDRVKKMIDMYEKTLKGNEQQKAKVRQELGSIAGGMPEVVFLQKDVVDFCQNALVEVQTARRELDNSI